MASKYISVRCPGCDGTLEYNVDKKVWICKYCGNEIRREEEYDGLYTIKNVIRQVLVDIAFVRLDSAQKNLIECQKISATYVGTLIADLCLKIFTLTIPGACPANQVKSIYGQVKRIYEQIQAIDPAISSEEEALYESFEDCGDAFGVLLLTFDTLGASAHADFVLKFLDPANVYSDSLNTNLLNYAIKKNHPDLADAVFANPDNLNCRKALFTLLRRYPDGEKKRTFITSLFARANFQSEDYKSIDSYLKQSKDSTGTKVLVYTKAAEKSMAPSISTVTGSILQSEDITRDQINEVLASFSATKPKDAELDELLAEIYLDFEPQPALFMMQSLLDTGLFIRPQEKLVRSMVLRSDWSPEDRAAMLRYAQQGKLDFRTNDRILGDILLKDRESTQGRIVLVRTMEEYVESISTGVLGEYLLHCTLDGEQKPDMMEEIFKLHLNMSFYQDIINQYAQNSPDSAEVTRQITQKFSARGLTVDPGVLVNLAVNTDPEDEMDTACYIQQSAEDGAQIGNKDLSIYLEQVSPDQMSGALIMELHKPTSIVTDLALAKYVLFSQDEFDLKLPNCLIFAENNGKPLGTSSVNLQLFGQNLTCNLLQAYIMAADDPDDLMSAIIDVMINQGAKLNAPVNADGQVMKFKKYALDHRTDFPDTALEILESQKVFSRFF